MNRNVSSILVSVLLLSACGSDKTATPAPSSAPAPAQAPAPAKPSAEIPKAPAEAPKPPVESAKPPVTTNKTLANADMDTAIKELMAKAEQPDEKIEIQHILISFQGAPRMRGVTRSKDEAKALAQKVWGEVVAGGDFDALVKQYTNDSAPGIYPMTKAGRAGMVKGFGDVGFRLKVGEVGVAPWDAAASPYGWHIIKRLK